MCKYIANFPSPIGNLVIKSDGKCVNEISLSSPESENPDSVTNIAINELKMYFDGCLTEFSFPVNPKGTDFQKRVWKILAEIPYGKTVSYGEVAEKAGSKNYARAVGGAVNKNPVLIAVPCHRVIGADGSLTGFACGLSVKKHLLNIEGIKYDT